MDRIIQAIEAMAGLEKKAEELVRMADIINNTMADAETGTLLAREGYRTDIAVRGPLTHDSGARCLPT